MHALDVDCAYLYGDVPDSVCGRVWLQLPQGMTPTLPPLGSYYWPGSTAYIIRFAFFGVTVVPKTS